jgi:(p)ppGpp synthase/HD superfamily hydrolase
MNSRVKFHYSAKHFQRATSFAANAHLGEPIPGTQIPYVAHVFLVAMEILRNLEEFPDEDPDLLLQAALLHDVLEDTKTTRAQLREEFGDQVESNVVLLSKVILSENSEKKSLDEYLEGLANGPRSAQIIKMADRIVNLRPPPALWDQEKITEYHKESQKILCRLGPANQALADRLKQKIGQYKTRFVNSDHR